MRGICGWYPDVGIFIYLNHQTHKTEILISSSEISISNESAKSDNSILKTAIKSAAESQQYRMELLIGLKTNFQYQSGNDKMRLEISGNFLSRKFPKKFLGYYNSKALGMSKNL